MKKILIAFIAASIAWIGGCVDSENSIKKLYEPGVTGNLCLFVKNGETDPLSRTVMPGENPIESYLISGSGPDGSTFQDIVTGGMLNKQGILAGMWYISVQAMNSSDSVIATGNGSVTVEAYSTTSMEIDLVPASGTGIFNLTFSWPEQFSSYTVSASLDNSGIELSAIDNHTVGYNVSGLNSGSHILIIQLFNGSIYYDVATVIESVIIANGQTTTASIVLGPEDINVPPAAPSDLTVNNVAPNQVTLNWTDNSQLEHLYYVYRLDQNGELVSGKSLSANTTTYTDTGLASKTRYIYHVSAVNRYGESNYVEIELTTLPSPALITVKQGSTIIANSDIWSGRTFTYDFGTVILNSFNEAEFIIENTGEADLLLNGDPVVSMTQTRGSETSTSYTVIQPSLVTIPGGSSTAFKIQFVPSDGGTYRGDVTIPNSDSTINPVQFTVWGKSYYGTIETPIVTPAGGTYNDYQNVSFSCADSSATVQWSEDNGTTWNTGTSLLVNRSKTVLVKAVKTDWADSATVTSVYDILTPEPPTCMATSYPRMFGAWPSPDDPNADYYKVYRVQVSGNVAAPTDESVYTFMGCAYHNGYFDPMLPANTYYYYRLKAVNQYGESSMSLPSQRGVVPWATTAYCSALTNLSASADTETVGIKISWDLYRSEASVSTSDMYTVHVYRKIGETGDYYYLDDCLVQSRSGEMGTREWDINDCRFIDTAVENEHTYHYRAIVFIGDGGNSRSSQYSNEASIDF